MNNTAAVTIVGKAQNDRKNYQRSYLLGCTKVHEHYYSLSGMIIDNGCLENEYM